MATFYGIGIGPGDSELVTVKAKKYSANIGYFVHSLKPNAVPRVWH